MQKQKQRWGGGHTTHSSLPSSSRRTLALAQAAAHIAKTLSVGRIASICGWSTGAERLARAIGGVEGSGPHRPRRPEQGQGRPDKHCQ